MTLQNPSDPKKRPVPAQPPLPDSIPDSSFLVVDAGPPKARSLLVCDRQGRVDVARVRNAVALLQGDATWRSRPDYAAILARAELLLKNATSSAASPPPCDRHSFNTYIDAQSGLRAVVATRLSDGKRIVYARDFLKAAQVLQGFLRPAAGSNASPLVQMHAVAAQPVMGRVTALTVHTEVGPNAQPVAVVVDELTFVPVVVPAPPAPPAA